MNTQREENEIYNGELVMRYKSMTFQGSTMSFRSWFKLNKVFLLNRAPVSFYKFFFIYGFFIFLIGFYVGVVIT
jgi:hypothetical protein